MTNRQPVTEAAADDAAEAAAPPVDGLPGWLSDVLDDQPQFDGVWSENDRRWYLEGWHKLRRDILTVAATPAAKPEAGGRRV